MSATTFFAAARPLPDRLQPDPVTAPEAAPIERIGRAPTTVDVAVGRRIREHRRALGKTQKELAELIGVTNVQLHRYETGATRVAAGRLFAIANALGIHVNRLADVAEPPEPETSGMHREAQDLMTAFLAISDARHRAALISLARSMAKVDQAGAVAEVER